MKMILLAGASLIAAANPAFAQHAGHAGHASHGAPAAPAASCTPEHAAMGHCTMPEAAPKAAPACTPEHAAMGHCTMPKADAAGHEGHGAHHGHGAHGGHDAAKPAAAPVADPHAGHAGHGAATPAPVTATGHEAHGAAPVAADPHAGHGAAPAAPAADPHGAHGTGGTALPAGDAPAPAASPATYADRVWGADAMAASRKALRNDHGGGMFSQVIFDLAEYRMQKGHDGYHWEAEAWYGGDINRLVVKTEGEGEVGEGLESAEVQMLYSRAVSPYFDLQAGVRYDIEPNPSRVYATVGFEGLAPYWFETEGALFVSDKGDLLARIGGSYDQRVTQRLILQPRIEANFAAQDVPEQGIGSGLSDLELGLRLRYEIVREFAPYIGVSWERSFGDTARFARAAGEGVEATSFVMGVRAWF
ncbi:copper resistance protein B [Sphingomonas sp. C3-2]|uniref:copper resistance protein B n=1 Tax=Sphingomonas sp. C3-2 TaxID=3062169 RepID=UPI00294B1A51|nr:copper resistance protein B [Sphingomonas sp. C3-2]WOK35898.1 copper resistance protein B [Sphingomonas sp. C3-2]